LPLGWYGWTIGARVEYFSMYGGAVADDIRERGVMERSKVCFKEIWLEGLQMGAKQPQPRDREVVRGCLRKLGWLERPVGNHRIDAHCYKTQTCVFDRPPEELMLR